MITRLRILFFVLSLVSCDQGAYCATRYAFVVGISTYIHVPSLPNPETDASKITKSLQSIGFEVTHVAKQRNDREALLDEWEAFLRKINPGDDVVVYYAGHGVDIKGQNWLVPSNAPAMAVTRSPTSLTEHLISLTDLMGALEDREVSTQIWVLDACRDNPFSDDGRSIAAGKGLQTQTTPSKVSSFEVLYSANYGQQALDSLPGDKPGDGSPYSRAFLELLTTEGAQPIEIFARDLRRKVHEMVAPDPQYPVAMDGTYGPWCFRKCAIVVSALKVTSKAETVSAGRDRIDEAHPCSRDKIAANNAFDCMFEPTDASDKVFRHYSGPEKNAVFLGKKSGVGCQNPNEDTRPFGCETLRLIVKGGDSNLIVSKILNRPLKAITNVNIRRVLPQIVSDKEVIYPCIAGRVNVGAQVELSSIAAISYLGDVFYWGTLKKKPLNCKV